MPTLNDVLQHTDTTNDRPAVTGEVLRHADNAAVVKLTDGREALLPLTESPMETLPPVGWAGPMLLLSAGDKMRVSLTHPSLLTALAATVVPEIREGTIRVMNTARLPGVRAKIAVAASTDGIDPVSVVVGRKANRVRALTNLLSGERVDVVAWAPTREEKLRNAFAPAEVDNITINDHEASVEVKPHLISAAVGQGGLNAILAGRLAGVRVTVSKTGPHQD